MANKLVQIAVLKSMLEQRKLTLDEKTFKDLEKDSLAKIKKLEGELNV